MQSSYVVDYEKQHNHRLRMALLSVRWGLLIQVDCGSVALKCFVYIKNFSKIQKKFKLF